ncbi:MAG: response regulator [Balneolaceae bacterium]|nr:response regulator [Balneolaceae bacterium]MCH8550154.1 response regulator [Balneolaceae bacterium]
MKPEIVILVVEDEPEVLDAIVRDINEFEDFFDVEMADTAEEAEEIINGLPDREQQIGLILCDHVLPGKNGVDLLIEMQENELTRNTRKVLITGQAGLDETVKAVNKADLKHYIAKPWDPNELSDITRKLLTDYVIDHIKNPLPYMQILDAERLADHMRQHGTITDS